MLEAGPKRAMRYRARVGLALLPPPPLPGPQGQAAVGKGEHLLQSSGRRGDLWYFVEGQIARNHATAPLGTIALARFDASTVMLLRLSRLYWMTPLTQSWAVEASTAGLMEAWFHTAQAIAAVPLSWRLVRRLRVLRHKTSELF